MIENFTYLCPNIKLAFLYFNDQFEDQTERIAADLVLDLRDPL